MYPKGEMRTSVRTYGCTRTAPERSPRTIPSIRTLVLSYAVRVMTVLDLRECGLAWDSASAEETERMGEALGKLLQPGDVVALFGELGSGKTVLVRGFAKVLQTLLAEPLKGVG